MISEIQFFFYLVIILYWRLLVLAVPRLNRGRGRGLEDVVKVLTLEPVSTYTNVDFSIFMLYLKYCARYFVGFSS